MKTFMVQTEQQIYARIMEMKLNLENTEAFTKIAMENPIFAEIQSRRNHIKILYCSGVL